MHRIGEPVVRRWDADHDVRSPRGWWARAESGRCVGCDTWVVDAYYCYDCAIRKSDRRADDERAPTATQVSHAQQRMVDLAAAQEQLIQLQTINADGVMTIGDSDESVRSVKIRRMRSDNQARYFTPQEFARASEIMGPAKLAGSDKYASKDLRRADRRQRATHSPQTA